MIWTDLVFHTALESCCGHVTMNCCKRLWLLQDMQVYTRSYQPTSVRSSFASEECNGADDEKQEHKLASGDLLVYDIFGKIWPRVTNGH